MDQALADLGYTSPYLIDGGHVWTHGLGEQRRYAVQHTLRCQIWELDQPHFLHAHGRSVTGHPHRRSNTVTWRRCVSNGRLWRGSRTTNRTDPLSMNSHRADTAHTTWRDVGLVALDLEGTGAQDRDREAILEIAVVPIIRGEAVVADAYCTLINPGRPITMRPWISPGLTNETLSRAPAIIDVEPELARRVNGRVLVGHNINVDWRLLHRVCATVKPAGLLDTLRLARRLRNGAKNGLTGLLDRFDLTGHVNELAAGSQPHRALWDAAAAAVLLRCLIDQAWRDEPTIGELLDVAGIPISSVQPAGQAQLSLLDAGPHSGEVTR